MGVVWCLFKVCDIFKVVVMICEVKVLGLEICVILGMFSGD